MIENLKPFLSSPQVEIKTGDVGGDDDIDPIARFLECFGGVDLRLESVGDLAKEIDFPFGIETADGTDLPQAGVVVGVAQGLRRPALGLIGSGADAAAGTAVQLRNRLGADDNELKPRLLQTIKRNLE